MKKILFILVCLSVFSGSFFAQSATETDETETQEVYEENKTKIKVIVPDDQHTTEKTASVKLEYLPMYDEVRIYYDCMLVAYDRGEAMNTVIACLQDFQKENNYYGYKYLKPDRERYYKNSRGYSMAQYISIVKFSR